MLLVSGYVRFLLSHLAQLNIQRESESSVSTFVCVMITFLRLCPADPTLCCQNKGTNMPADICRRTSLRLLFSPNKSLITLTSLLSSNVSLYHWHRDYWAETFEAEALKHSGCEMLVAVC